MSVRALTRQGALLVAIAALAGCSDDAPTNPQTPGQGGLVIEHFVGTLPVKGTLFYSFSVETNGGTTYLTLVEARENGVITDKLVTIGLGVPRGTQCVATNVLSVTSSGAPHLSGATNKGIHCVTVTDLGNLTSPATFLVNIAHPK